MDKRVIKPLQQLLETFQGPTRLITKRQDKHLDFSAFAQRAEKNKDPTKNKSVSHQNTIRNLLDEKLVKCWVLHLFVLTTLISREKPSNKNG